MDAIWRKLDYEIVSLILEQMIISKLRDTLYNLKCLFLIDIIRKHNGFITGKILWLGIDDLIIISNGPYHPVPGIIIKGCSMLQELYGRNIRFKYRYKLDDWIYYDGYRLGQNFHSISKILINQYMYVELPKIYRSNSMEIYKKLSTRNVLYGSEKIFIDNCNLIKYLLKSGMKPIILWN
jgi:hypothetical protein